MSSRALRKLQREREEQQQLSKLQASGEESLDEDGDVEELSSQPKVNTFDMLNIASEDDELERNNKTSVRSEDSDLEGAKPAQKKDNPDLPTQAQNEASRPAKRRPKKRAKKRKDPLKKDETHTIETKPKLSKEQAELDEIDLALLSLKDKDQDVKEQNSERRGPSEDLKYLYTLLSIDTKYLNALNEMKRLFGNVVLESEGVEPAAAVAGRRRGRGPQHVDLGGALAGRNSPISRGQGLAGLALRRNVFMLGKEEWPKATSGGLSMEVVEKAWDLTTEYRFVHNAMYQDVQRQFESCVESMDPQRMIQLLQYNPYHISTLLQVSEIAKQQGDHSVSGDLLERALFSFGRSVHSSFHSALSEGKARFDFRRPENREFWLASWRYIGNLGQRGTWRTAYEWGKLILSLDPEEDPFCIHMILDQLALRGGQEENLVNLCKTVGNLFDWSHDSPNINISLGLAESRLKRPEACRATLRKAVHAFPWVFTRLFQELNIGHTPRSIWGKEPRTQREKLLCEAYVARAKDLWNTPEGVSLLVEVTESVRAIEDSPTIDYPVSLNEARHIMLSDTPHLISLVPHEYTTSRSSASDPLPPIDNLPSYNLGDSTAQPDEWDDEEGSNTTRGTGAPTQQAEEAEEYSGLQAYFSRLIPWFSRTGTLSAEANADQPTPEASESDIEGLARVMEESGVGPELFEERGARLIELHGRLAAVQQHRMEEAEQEFLANDPGQREMEEALMSSITSGGVESFLAGVNANNLDQLLQNPPQSHIETTSATDADVAGSGEGSASVPYDDERNQRWLAGQGMMQLRDFVAEHGTDEKVWQSDSSVDTSPVTEYARRVNLLQRRASRNFILDYPLQQGTSSEVRALVIRFADAANKRS